MEIFGKRPFVLKTGEMISKINAIRIDDIRSKKDNSIVNNVKRWLGNVSYLANLFKTFQNTASELRKNLHGKSLNQITNEERAKLSYLKVKIEDEKYNDIIISSNFSILSTDSFLEILKKNKEQGELSIELLKKINNSCGRLTTKHKKEDLVKTLEDWLKTVEKDCRKIKRKFKKMFEKVYKALKSYIEKVEKGKSEEDIKQVAKSELDVFKKYEISLEDEGCSESEKHCEKGNDAFEETNIEISEDDNLLVGKVQDWLEKVEKHAKIYQDAHEAASNIITYKKHKQSDLVNEELKKLYDAAQKVKQMLDKEQIDCVTCYQDFKGLVDSDKFPETYEVEEANMTAIKEGCQEAQKALLEAYEKVSESLESYIKKLDEVKKANEKGTDQKDIKKVAASEIEVFKGYSIQV